MGLWFTPVRAPQPASALVSAYAARLAALVFQHNTGGSPPPGSVTQVDITISDVSTPLSLGVDESYTLNVDANGDFTITSKTVYGAFMALQVCACLGWRLCVPPHEQMKKWVCLCAFMSLHRLALPLFLAHILRHACTVASFPLPSNIEYAQWGAQ